MKLRTIILEGFRGYANRVEIQVSDLTAIVGRNDAGKSTILEALEIFFNNKVVKIEQEDACQSAGAVATSVLIGCVFDELPAELVLDSSAPTSLAQEELLNGAGLLEVHKVFNCAVKAPKAKTFVVGHHRLRADGTSLLQLNNAALKAAAKEAGLSVADKKQNPLLRAALRDLLDAAPQETLLQMDEGNCPAILRGIQKQFPLFALFRSDRPSTDGDSEVQDPVRLAVDQAIQTAQVELDAAEKLVTQRVEEVLQRTLAKLKQMDPSLASELKPRIQPPAWRKAFSVKLDSDDGIPLNKRGSGVRRLILLNFFRAEAERRMTADHAPSVIYAIEEPETSQHPRNQRILMEAFLELAGAGTAQVLITTHVPGLAGMVPADSIRYVRAGVSGHQEVRSTADDGGGEAILKEIAEALGVIPDSRVEVLFFVEGPNDVSFFKNASQTLATADPNVPNLCEERAVAFVPVGGRTLEQWVDCHYLSELGRPEFHVYDGDYVDDPKIMAVIAHVNARTDGSRAVILKRRAAESYLHLAAIARCCGVTVAPGVDDCVATVVSDAMKEAGLKIALGEGKAARPHKNVVKRFLNGEVAESMTAAEWSDSDPGGEVSCLLRDLSSFIGH